MESSVANPMKSKRHYDLLCYITWSERKIKCTIADTTGGRRKSRKGSEIMMINCSKPALFDAWGKQRLMRTYICDGAGIVPRWWAIALITFETLARAHQRKLAVVWQAWINCETRWNVRRDLSAAARPLALLAANRLLMCKRCNMKFSTPWHQGVLGTVNSTACVDIAAENCYRLRNSLHQIYQHI